MTSLRMTIMVIAMSSVSAIAHGFDMARAERVFAQHCAVCHGADRGGYIAPALNRDETTLSRALVEQRIVAGLPTTLMPAHPSWRDGLSAKDRELLIDLVTMHPKSTLEWSIDDVRDSLEVFVADESGLPDAPRYRIDHIDDLMAVMSRGRRARGDEAKVVFFNGRTHRRVGEVPTDYAPHLMDFHPTQPRWAYVRDDGGFVHKVDLYSMKVVRKVRAGLNGTSLAVSGDGRYVAAGSYVPRTMVILDAETLEPVHLLELAGVDPDGRMVTADAGIITATPFANIFVVALEQAGQVWIVDLDRPGMPVTSIPDVGRHLHDGFLSPDGSIFVVSSYDDNLNAVIDLAQARILRKVPAGCQPHLGSGAVVRQSSGRLLGIGTNIGEADCESFEVTVFDMETFDLVRQVPVAGPTESPAAHPEAPYILVDIVGAGPRANMIQLIDKETLEVAHTLEVAGTLGHSHFPEYTARGDFFYVSSRFRGDLSSGAPAGRLVIFDSHSLAEIRSIPMDVPAGVFSRSRARTVVVGLQGPMPQGPDPLQP